VRGYAISGQGTPLTPTLSPWERGKCPAVIPGRTFRCEPDPKGHAKRGNP